MYRKQIWERRLLFLAGGIAVGICLALIVFFVYTLVLRAEYRRVCLEINDTILQTELASATVERGGKAWPIDRKTLDYYDKRLLDDGVTVFSRGDVAPNDASIWIHLGARSLCFTGGEDGSVIYVAWNTPQGRKTYALRSGSVSFMQDSAYLSNYIRKLA